MPSVNSEKVRMMIVITPIRMPAIHCTVLSLGAETGSVTMKTAPNIKPPDSSVNQGAALLTPVRYSTLDRTPAPSSVDTIICQLAAFLYSR